MTELFAGMQKQTEETKKTVVKKQASTQNAEKMGNKATINSEKKVYYKKIVEKARTAFAELNKETKSFVKKAEKITNEEAEENFVGVVLVKRNDIIELRAEQIKYYEKSQKNKEPIEEIDIKMKDYDSKIKKAEEKYILSVEEYIKKYGNVTPKNIIDSLENEVQKAYERIDNINANLLGMGYRNSHTYDYTRKIMEIIEYQITMDKRNKEKSFEQIQNEIEDKREYIRRSVLECSNAYKSDQKTAEEVIKSTYKYDHGYGTEFNESINSIITLGIISNIDKKETRENLLNQYEDNTSYGSGKNIKTNYFLTNTFTHTEKSQMYS